MIPLIGQQATQQVAIEYDPKTRTLLIKRGIDWTVLALPLELIKTLHEEFSLTLDAHARPLTGDGSFAAFDPTRRATG